MHRIHSEHITSAAHVLSEGLRRVLSENLDQKMSEEFHQVLSQVLTERTFIKCRSKL